MLMEWIQVKFCVYNNSLGLSVKVQSALLNLKQNHNVFWNISHKEIVSLLCYGRIKHLKLISKLK